MNNVHLGEIVQSLVYEKKMTASKFAEKIGIKRQNVKKTVFEKHGLDTDLVCKINEVLGCNLFDYYKPCNAEHYTSMKATVIIEMGEQQQGRSFTILFPESK